MSRLVSYIERVHALSFVVVNGSENARSVESECGSKDTHRAEINKIEPTDRVVKENVCMRVRVSVCVCVSGEQHELDFDCGSTFAVLSQRIDACCFQYGHNLCVNHFIMLFFSLSKSKTTNSNVTTVTMAVAAPTTTTSTKSHIFCLSHGSYFVRLYWL